MSLCGAMVTVCMLAEADVIVSSALKRENQCLTRESGNETCCVHMLALCMILTRTLQGYRVEILNTQKLPKYFLKQRKLTICFQAKSF